MTEIVGDYELLFKELQEIGATDSSAYLDYLFSRTSVIINESSDENARNFISNCKKTIKSEKSPLKNDAIHHLQYLLLNYSDDDHLKPPHKEHYFSMPMPMGFSFAKYSNSADETIFTHACAQYETMLQVADYLIDTPGAYARDLKEVSDKFIHQLEKNTYFEKFSRLVNKG